MLNSGSRNEIVKVVFVVLSNLCNVQNHGDPKSQKIMVLIVDIRFDLPASSGVLLLQNLIPT